MDNIEKALDQLRGPITIEDIFKLIVNDILVVPPELKGPMMVALFDAAWIDGGWSKENPIEELRLTVVKLTKKITDEKLPAFSKEVGNAVETKKLFRKIRRGLRNLLSDQNAV